MRKKFLTAIAAVLCVAVGIVIGFVLFKKSYFSYI